MTRFPSPALQEVLPKDGAFHRPVWMRSWFTLWVESGSTPLRCGETQSRKHDFPLSDPDRKATRSSGLKIWRKRLTSIPEFARKFLNFIIAEVISAPQANTNIRFRCVL